MYQVQVISSSGVHKVIAVADNAMAAIIDVLVQLEFETLECVLGISVSVKENACIK
jgi:hypothetical protein